MAESPEDKDVDALIATLQADLDRLKAAQSKDVQDEDGEEQQEQEPSQAKNLSEAGKDAYIRVRAHNRRVRQAGQAADAADRAK